MSPDCARILAIACTFNRRAISERGISSLLASARHAGVQLSVLVIDDGSTDGTAPALRDIGGGRDVEVVTSDGSLYWAGAMRRGMEIALSRTQDFDHVLLFNDDVAVEPGGVDALVRDAGLRTDSIVVGQCRSADGSPTYGGYLPKDRWKRLSFRPVQQGERCTAFNANMVLVGREAFVALGPFPLPYQHNLADFDYGLRAAQLGIDARVSTRVVGVCERNDPAVSWLNTTLPLRERWRLMRAPKGLPARPWFHYCFTHGGPVGPAYALAPYLRLVLTGLTTRK